MELLRDTNIQINLSCPVGKAWWCRFFTFKVATRGNFRKPKPLHLQYVVGRYHGLQMCSKVTVELDGG